MGPAQDWQTHADIPDLTPEELSALQPKKTKVVNPWIHEQTHQEYLENITVSKILDPGQGFHIGISAPLKPSKAIKQDWGARLSSLATQLSI